MRAIPFTAVSVLGLSLGFTAGLILLPDQPGIEVNQSQYANHWPFEVEQARLRCEGKGAVILTVRGTDYAVNGMAASNRYRPIQARSEERRVGKECRSRWSTDQ